VLPDIKSQGWTQQNMEWKNNINQKKRNATALGYAAGSLTPKWRGSVKGTW